ncbi:hypothetical protein JCM10908_003900 [Rhodotorula pacifica]|uniref:uncharacterized protein n=1 Tax=Rhodotorula pacifica TaxID=1495444 RepID=UPI003173D2A9
MADPAFRGFVETTLDALLVLEGCRRGLLPKITRRLQEFEKRALVVSGAVFVFHEEETGIKRWTDGLSWSPSRTLDNFLVYRELDRKPASGRSSDAGDDGEPVVKPSRSRLIGPLTSKADPVDGDNEVEVDTNGEGSTTKRRRARASSSSSGGPSALALDRARERALVGSLTSSSRFSVDGLVKKTISLSGLHLVSYYRIEDVTSGRLRTPSSHAELMSLEISPSFLAPSLFRLPPVVEIDANGHVRYKGDADAPLSPRTHTSSSPGAQATAIANNSRPNSSESTSNHKPSLPVPSWEVATAQGPHRRSIPPTARHDNRFDPYGASRLPYGALPYPDTLPAAQQEPAHLRSFPVDGLPYSSMPTYADTNVPSGFRLPDTTPNYSPLQGWQRFQAQVQAPYVPTTLAGDSMLPTSAAFQQPRLSVPSLPTPGTAARDMFSFNAPNSSDPQSLGQLATRQPPHTAVGYGDNVSRYSSGVVSQQGFAYGGDNLRRSQPTPLWPLPLTSDPAFQQHQRDGTQSPFVTPPATADPLRPIAASTEHPQRWATTLQPYSSAMTVPGDPHAAAGASYDWQRAVPYPRATSALASTHSLPHPSSSSELSPLTPGDGALSRLQQQQQQALEQLYDHDAAGHSAQFSTAVGSSHDMSHLRGAYDSTYILPKGSGPSSSAANGLVQPALDSYKRDACSVDVSGLVRPRYDSYDYGPEQQYSAAVIPGEGGVGPHSRPASRFAAGPPEPMYSHLAPLDRSSAPQTTGIPSSISTPVHNSSMLNQAAQALRPPQEWSTTTATTAATTTGGHPRGDGVKTEAVEDMSFPTSTNGADVAYKQHSLSDAPQQQQQQWWPNGSPWARQGPPTVPHPSQYRQ